MRFKQSRLWSLALILLLCLGALLILFFFQSRKTTEPEVFGELSKTDALILSSDDLSNLLHRELSQYLPFEVLEAAISKDGSVALHASVKKADALKLLETQNASLHYVAPLLPDAIDTQLSFRISQEDGILRFEPLQIKVATFDLTEILSPKLTDALNAAIAHYFEKKEIEILSFKVLSDAISMNIKKSVG